MIADVPISCQALSSGLRKRRQVKWAATTTEAATSNKPWGTPKTRIGAVNIHALSHLAGRAMSEGLNQRHRKGARKSQLSLHPRKMVDTNAKPILPEKRYIEKNAAQAKIAKL